MAFDRSLVLMRMLEARNEPIRPGAETVITIVEDEIGILPKANEQNIREIMKLKPA